MKKITEISLKTFYCDAAKWFNEMFFANMWKASLCIPAQSFWWSKFFKTHVKKKKNLLKRKITTAKFDKNKIILWLLKYKL